MGSFAVTRPWRVAVVVFAATATAAPPYVSDHPEPTDFAHYEIYLCDEGISTIAGSSRAAGIDFNYDAPRNLQLSAVVPVEYQPAASGLGNTELAAKYRFVHQSQAGWDVAIFPRLFLPSGSAKVGERHASFLVPLWLKRDWGPGSTVGGGGCALDCGGNSQNYCLAGWALVRQMSATLQLGAELVYPSSPLRGARASTSVGGGARYDLSKIYHLLAYAGPGPEDASEPDRYSWYVSAARDFLKKDAM